MKKIFKYLSLALLLSVVGFGVAQKSNQVVRTEAASPTTKRVWVHTTYLTWWRDAGAETRLHYWNASGDVTSWPGTLMTLDASNDLFYLDIQADITGAVIARVQPGTNNVWDQTVNLNITNGDLNTKRVELWTSKQGNHFEAGVGISFSPNTTTVVSNYAATIDTAAEACNATAAGDAIVYYNDSLATFEQRQYAALDVGGGKTGSDRLNYLKAFYNISTPIHVPPAAVRMNDSSETGMTAMIIIGGLSVVSLGGYFFISKKKLFG